MRARNIKPGFFKNPELVECPVEARLLFAGLWCLADREGRLEDRPKGIKMQVFPADSFDVDKLLDVLVSVGLIERYSAAMNGKQIRVIQVMKFTQHQHPHQKEPPSILPESGASPVPAPDKPSADPADSLIPDSLIPESSLREGAPDWFDAFKAAYPKRAGNQPWPKARSAGSARIREGHKPEEFLEGAKRYAAFCRETGKTGSETVLQAATFLGPDKPFTQDWAAPTNIARPAFKTAEQIAKDRFLAGEI